MSNWYWRISDELDPADGTIDLSSLVGPAEIPQVFSIVYWVSTAGGILSGAFSLSFDYNDIQAQDRTEPGAPISLQDPTAFTRIQGILFTRSSAAGKLELTTNLDGLVDGAKVRYAFLISPGAGEGNSAI